MQIIKSFLVIFSFLCYSADAYLGTFDPAPLRSEALITFIDAQVPGPLCIAYGSDYAPNILLSPLIVQVAGCALYDKRIVIVPISAGLGQLYGLHVLAIPDGNLGHETRHIFDGQFHNPLFSFIDNRVQQPSAKTGTNDTSE